MKDTFLAYLGKSLNLPVDSVAERLFKKSDDNTLTDDLSENALDELLRLDAERIQKLKGDTKQFFDNGYGKGKSETAAQFEKMIREKFGVDTSGQLQGEALIEAVKAATAGESPKPDKVKTSAEYLALENQIAEIKRQYEEQVQQVKQEAEREKTWTDVRGEIIKTIRGMGNVNQEAVTDLMIDLFASKYRQFDFQRDEKGFLPLKDGARVENAQGHARLLHELVSEEAAQVFPTQKQQAAGSAGNMNGGQGQPATVVGAFKDETDFHTQYNAEADFGKKQALYQAWEKQTQGN